MAKAKATKFEISAEEKIVLEMLRNGKLTVSEGKDSVEKKIPVNYDILEKELEKGETLEKISVSMFKGHVIIHIPMENGKIFSKGVEALSEAILPKNAKIIKEIAEDTKSGVINL